MDKIYLNNNWTYYDNFDNQANGENVNIPHSNCVYNYNYINEKDYQKTCCYKKEIFVSKDYQNKLIFLVCDGIAHVSTIYINGVEVCKHMCGYDSFKVDISSHLKFDSDNEIKIKVESSEKLNIPPFGNVIDYLTYGGIYRDVYLNIKNVDYIEDVSVFPFFNNNAWDLDIKADIKSDKYEITHFLMDEDKIIDQTSSSEFKGLKEITCWDINNPKLYKLKTIIKCNDEMVDEDVVTFGFRTCKFEVDGFYLNGSKIKLLGLNRHQSFPYVGYAMPESMQRHDARILKYELGVNIVRTSHYPQSQYFIDECDKIGLLVFTEIPGWQHIGDEKWQEIAVENTKNMVLQYRNHPSIILWGVRINESGDNEKLYSKTNDIAHALDKTRQTGGVRTYKKGILQEDVFTYNDFINPNEKNALSLKKDVSQYKNKPYLITEFNGHMYPTKKYDDEIHRQNHMLRYARIINEAFGRTDISGCIGWCMFDYNTHKDFGSGDKICYHGVMDMFRNPKLPSYLYASQFLNDNILKLSSSMNIGDHPAGMIDGLYIISNADCIKFYKNDEYVNTFYPSNSKYSNLPHPIIYVEDMVGELLCKHEGYSSKVSNQIKKVLFGILKYGNKMPLSTKLIMFKLMMFNKMTIQKGYELYGKYVGNWGCNKLTYRFEAIKNDEVVNQIVLSDFESIKYNFNVSNTNLTIKSSYDVASIRISACDQNNNLLSYYFEPLELKCEGNIELIGPEIISFTGGLTGTYVKSKQKEGNGKLLVYQNKNLIKEIKFNIVVDKTFVQA